MTSYKNDDELFAAIREKLFTAVVGDILDVMGYRHQFLPPHIKPLRDDMVVLGRAMTVLEADYFEPEPSQGKGPFSHQGFGLMFHALDDLKPNEVYVCAGASPNYAVWGELMSTRAMHLKANGAICDGYCRDSEGILKLNFPTFSHGTYAQDQGPRGKVIDYRVPIEIGKIRINPGDLMFGDRDGVLVIPQAAEEEAIARAFEKASTENKVRLAIEGGMSTVEAYERFGVM